MYNYKEGDRVRLVRPDRESIKKMCIYGINKREPMVVVYTVDELRTSRGILLRVRRGKVNFLVYSDEIKPYRQECMMS